MRPGSRSQPPGVHIYLQDKEGLSSPQAMSTAGWGPGAVLLQSGWQQQLVPLRTASLQLQAGQEGLLE